MTGPDWQEDPAARELVEVAARWARERSEMRSVLGAVLDSVTDQTDVAGRFIAYLSTAVVDELHRLVGR